MTLAEMLVSELSRRRCTQRSLALQIGVSPQTIANVLRGSRPDLSTVYKLSQVLDEPLGVLLQVAGLAPWIDLNRDRGIVPMVDDWPTLKVLQMMRSFPKTRKRRALQMLELLAEDEY